MSIFHKSSLSLGGLLDVCSETFHAESQSKLVSLNGQLQSGWSKLHLEHRNRNRIPDLFVKEVQGSLENTPAMIFDSKDIHNK